MKEAPGLRATQSLRLNPSGLLCNALGPRIVGEWELAGASEVSHPEPSRFVSTAHMILSAIKCLGDGGGRGEAQRRAELSGLEGPPSRTWGHCQYATSPEKPS